MVSYIYSNWLGTALNFPRKSGSGVKGDIFVLASKPLLMISRYSSTQSCNKVGFAVQTQKHSWHTERQTTVIDSQTMLENDDKT